MKVKIEEVNIGVADCSRVLEVNALNRKEATKKLKRYLENFYEDTIKFCPFKGYFEATFQRNGGKLILTYLD